MCITSTGVELSRSSCEINPKDIPRYEKMEYRPSKLVNLFANEVKYKISIFKGHHYRSQSNLQGYHISSRS